MRNRNNVTESSVEKAKLTPNEAKVIRVFYNLEAAGSKKSRKSKKRKRGRITFVRFEGKIGLFYGVSK